LAKKKSAAKKTKINKSQAVRDYLKSHRRAKPAAVSEALKAEGIDVSPQAVSTVKSNMKKKKGGKRRSAGGRKAASRKTSGGGDTISVSALLDAKRLVDKLGSVEKAKTALDALGKLK